MIEKLEKKIKIKESVGLILNETDGSQCLDDKKILSPRMYLKNGNLSVIYGGQILNHFESFIDAFSYLFGIYFCLDLVYPDIFKQELGLFHQFLFSSFKNVDVKRNLGFVNISSLLE